MQNYMKETNILATKKALKEKKGLTDKNTGKIKFLEEMKANEPKPLPPEKYLYKEALKHLKVTTEINRIPWFDLTPLKSSTQHPFAHFFVAQWQRNAYGGLFVHLNPENKPMNSEKRAWIERMRHKGYACVSVSSAHDFKHVVKDYAHSSGQIGKQYFNTRWERFL